MLRSLASQWPDDASGFHVGLLCKRADVYLHDARINGFFRRVAWLELREHWLSQPAHSDGSEHYCMSVEFLWWGWDHGWWTKDVTWPDRPEDRPEKADFSRAGNTTDLSPNSAPPASARVLRHGCIVWATIFEREADPIAQRSSQRTPPPSAEPPAPPSRPDNQTEWLAKAMLLVRDHPDWPDTEIARNVGRHPGTLSRSNEYAVAAKLARGSKTDRHRGHVKIDRETGTAGMEAIAPLEASESDHSDRGKSIPGSKYFMEYCDICDDPMRVTQGKVGTKPLCDECTE